MRRSARRGRWPRGSRITTALAAIPPVISTVLPAIDAVRDDLRGADDRRGPSDRCADHSSACGTGWTEWHLRLLPRLRLPLSTRRSPGSGSDRSRSAGRRSGARPTRRAQPTCSPRRGRRPCCRSRARARGARCHRRRGSLRPRSRGRGARRPLRARRSRRPRARRARSLCSTMRSSTRINPRSTRESSSLAISPSKLLWSAANSTTR